VRALFVKNKVRFARAEQQLWFGVYISGIWGGAKPPERIKPNFLEGRYPWCNHVFHIRFRGLASTEGQILPFPIDFDGRPYNTLSLPCEHVILQW